LSSVKDATASPPSSALQAENSFCVILLKVNVSAHKKEVEKDAFFPG